MTPQRLLETAINPALAELAALGIPSSREAARFLLAIALQESALRYRRQVVAGGAEMGPAASFWQFEKGGGCVGVLTHRAAAENMKAVCALYNIKPDAQGLWDAMRYNDIVAAVAARLLVYTLPGKLPATSENGWTQYVSAWRPGKPELSRWRDAWVAASQTVGVPA